MAREKFGTLTEQMFYILLALDQASCGVDIMERIRSLTAGRVTLGPGTLYALLADFQKAGYIAETAVEGRRRTYALTQAGRARYWDEVARLRACIADAEEEERLWKPAPCAD